MPHQQNKGKKYMIISIDTERNLTKFNSFMIKNTQKTRTKKRLSQYNKKPYVKNLQQTLYSV